MSQFIEIYENALSQDVCDNLIAAHNKSERITPGRTGGGIDKALKDSLDVGMDQEAQWQPLVRPVLGAIQHCMREYFITHPSALVSAITPTIKDPQSGKTTTINIDNFNTLGLQYIDQVTGYLFKYTGMTVQKYLKNEGGYHYFHSEIYPQLNKNDALHRELAILVYLNDVETGGETEFYYQNIKTTPKAGSIVIFPAGFTHTHKGHIPISSDKYVIAAWLQFNDSEQIFRG